MAHMMKFTRGSIGTMTRHYERAKSKETGEYIKFSNQDININKTHENYNLAPKRNQLEFIKQRCDQANCLKRKDVNVMCSWIITLPKNLKEIEEFKFFLANYEFLKNRYGGEKNVISAYVHKDETTPHLHFSFVPVIYDETKKKERVSAKIMLNRMDLKTFHNDLENYLKPIFGREIGILNETTKEGNKSIEQLKRKSAKERITEANREASKIVSHAKEEVEDMKILLKPIQAEYEAKKAYIKACDKSSEISMLIPNYAEVKERGILKKQLFITVPIEKWEAKHVSADEKSYLRKATEELESSFSNLKKIASNITIKELNKKISSLENKLNIFEKENDNLKIDLNNMKKRENSIMNKINKVLDKLPEDMSIKFVEEWKSLENRPKNRNMGMER